ncbi:MAG TPA: hypothetical protein PKY12_07305 [Catalimonadaceae bacterium]|nr:hypothetical protein [Catalimonadaceae bacterium]
MKIQIPLFIVGILFSFNVSAQLNIDSLPPTEALDVITYYVGRSFNKEMGKAKIPQNCKIYALPFRCERDGIDTFATPLGMKISAELSFKFKRVIQGEKKLRNQNISIISPDNTNKQLFELMAQNLNPPSSFSEESEFWKNVSANQKPDYYLVGKYEIKGDYKSVRVSNVELIKDKLNPKLNAFQDKITLKDIEFPFESEDDRKMFQKLDANVGEIDQAYARLVRLASKGQFAQVDIVDEKTDKPITLNAELQVGKGYQLKMNLSQDAYIYAFYYESNDLTGNKMYLIFPFENGQKNFVKKGITMFPDEENVFSPSPPSANQVFIKLIASKRKLPLNITTSPEGYKYISPEDCLNFVKAMEKIPSAEIDSNNLIRGVE